jgi:hypothetical protein
MNDVTLTGFETSNYMFMQTQTQPCSSSLCPIRIVHDIAAITSCLSQYFNAFPSTRPFKLAVNKVTAAFDARGLWFPAGKIRGCGCETNLVRLQETPVVKMLLIP